MPLDPEIWLKAAGVAGLVIFTLFCLVFYLLKTNSAERAAIAKSQQEEREKIAAAQHAERELNRKERVQVQEVSSKAMGGVTGALKELSIAIEKTNAISEARRNG